MEEDAEKEEYQYCYVFEMYVRCDKQCEECSYYKV